MSDNNASLLTLRGCLRAVSRHRKKVALFFITTVTFVAVQVFSAPHTFRSEAKLFVRVGRESVSLDPTATTGQTIRLEKSLERDMNSAMEILRSRVVSEQVVDRLGPEAILGSLAKRDAAQQPPSLPAAASLHQLVLEPLARLRSRLATPARAPVDAALPSGAGSLRETAIAKLQKSIQISSPKLSNIMTIAASGSSAHSAQQTVGVLTDVFVEEYMRINRTRGSHSFFAQQAKLLHDQLREASQELRDAKNGFGLLTIEGQHAILEGQIQLVEDQLIENGIVLATTEARISYLEEQVADLPATMVTHSTSGLENSATQGIRQTLYDLELREEELRSRYTDDYPLVVAVRQQREQMEKIWKQQPQQREQAVHALNPLREQLRQDLLDQQGLAASMEAKSHSLTGLLADLQHKRTLLNDHELQIAELQRNVDLLEASYRSYSENVEQARIDEALENERISSINIVQPAILPIYPEGPKRRVTLALGLIIGSCGALGIALLAEHLDRTLKTPDQVEAQLGLPVLLSVPRCVRKSTLSAL